MSLSVRRRSRTDSGRCSRRGVSSRGDPWRPLSPASLTRPSSLGQPGGHLRAVKIHAGEDELQELGLAQPDVPAQPRLLVHLPVRQLDHRVERLQHALATDRHRADHRLLAPCARLLELGVGLAVRQIALVELDHDRDLGGVEPVLPHVGLQVFPVLVVLLAGAAAAVGDEGHRVGVLEHDTTGCVVDDLPGNREQLHLHGVAALGMEEDRQQIEEQGAVVVVSTVNSFPVPRSRCGRGSSGGWSFSPRDRGRSTRP